MAASSVTLIQEKLFSLTKKKVLKSPASILVLWGLGKLLKSTGHYRCPEEGYTLYGGMFLFGPALCISTLILVNSDSFWDALTSCFREKVDSVAVCRATLRALITSALPGLMWLILSFATTDYYICFQVGDKPDDSSESRKARRFSTVCAWLLLLISISLALVYISIDRCCFANTRKSTKLDFRDYQRIEAEAAILTLKKEAKVLARQQGEKEIKGILDEVKNGKTTLQVIQKAKKWIIDKYSRSKHKRKKNEDYSDGRFEEIEALIGAEKNTQDSTL